LDITNTNNNLDDSIFYSTLFMSGVSITINGLKKELADLKTQLKQQTIEWIPVSSVANEVGLSSDAIRKRLQNGNFEEGVDFKRDGNKIIVHQGAIGRLQRQRRSYNG